MKFQLTDYQTAAALEVQASVQEGYQRFATTKRLTAIALSAPTGAGKTVIATTVIEGLLYGADGRDAKPTTTVLWVTDDPSLNVQTRRKMLLSSSQIRPGQLVTVDPSLDQLVLDPGKVYFVHIQQLGRGSTSYIKVGNKRQFSLWDTIGNTISKRGTDFLLIVDEAHRGTSARSGGGKTITAQLMDGAGGSFPPTPVVLGISATPQRFADAISRLGQRTLVPVTVDAELVRESGLIKDKLRIKHPTESTPSDSTLLELAVKDLQLYEELWAEYAEEQQEPLVRPVLVVQVKPASSERDLKSILDTMSSTWNVLDGKAVAHAFQDHTTLSIGTRSVRYIAPQDIQDDPHLRVVLFKEALTTGWDCPRAEVMISLRTAQDHTYIAQLIGRMVRTPLARRIATNDVLNSVSLYLPYFDSSHVADVLRGLQSDESQITSEIEIDSVTCARNPDVPTKVWKALSQIPTYTRPGKFHRNDVARLNALATLLVGNKIDVSAMDVARKHLVDTLVREATRLGKLLDESVARMEALAYQVHSVDLRTGTVETESASVAVNAQNIDDLFRKAKRTLGDSSAKWYWDHLCAKQMDPDEAKVRVCALASERSVSVALEAAAKTLIDVWRTEHNGVIGKLSDAKRSHFYAIWQQSKVPEQIELVMPSQVTSGAAKEQFAKHLFAHKQLFPTKKLSTWERDVLEEELSKETLLGWYRNPIGGPAAIAVPYFESGISRTMYPDFIFFHQSGKGVAIDLVDPHSPSESDTASKWAGLAQYASNHATVFRRVAAVIRDTNGQLLSLDMKNPSVATAIGKASTQKDIEKAFDKFGGAY